MRVCAHPTTHGFGGWRRATPSYFLDRALEPAAFSERAIQTEADGRHRSEHQRVTKTPTQLGHEVEVHPVDTGDGGRDGGDGHPGRDPPHVLVLAHAHLDEVGLEYGGEDLTVCGDGFHHPQQMIVDVAEVVLQTRIHGRRFTLGEPFEGVEERLCALVELEDLALQVVDARSRILPGRGEHHRLQLLDVVVEAGQHRRVVVDHLVGNRVEDSSRTERQEVRTQLQAPASVGQGTSGAVPDVHDEVPADEELDFTQLDDLFGVHVTRRLQHHEQDVAVQLQLRPLMGANGVFHRQFVELELLPDRLELLRGGFEHPDPHKGARLSGGQSGTLDIEPVGGTPSVDVESRVDDHAVPPR